MQKNYIYLHGFASGPSSAKAQFFAEKFQQLNT
ncbi:MAG: YqiA/YcfP family alpha/beta fold hydrolase, partial [Microcoleaceae cyanobacterium]